MKEVLVIQEKVETNGVFDTGGSHLRPAPLYKTLPNRDTHHPLNHKYI
jgi:hypothetical protein